MPRHTNNTGSKNLQIITDFVLRNLFQIVLTISFFITIIITFNPFIKENELLNVYIPKLTVRKKPLRLSRARGRLTFGQKVIKIGHKNHWDRIIFNNYKTGWVPDWLINHKFPASFKESNLSESTILLDPGHGGGDSGALSVPHQQSPVNKHEEEKTYTLRTALEIRKILKRAGVNVIMTRKSDKYVTLNKRTKMANDLKVDAFISIHYDSSDIINEATGDTTYYYHRQNNSLNLAQNVNNQLRKNLNLHNLGVKFGNYYVLRENKQPAILIEGGYIDTGSDLNHIASHKYPEIVAKSIKKGLEKFLNDK